METRARPFIFGLEPLLGGWWRLLLPVLPWRSPLPHVRGLTESGGSAPWCSPSLVRWESTTEFPGLAFFRFRRFLFFGRGGGFSAPALRLWTLDFPLFSVVCATSPAQLRQHECCSERGGQGCWRTPRRWGGFLAAADSYLMREGVLLVLRVLPLSPSPLTSLAPPLSLWTV